MVQCACFTFQSSSVYSSKDDMPLPQQEGPASLSSPISHQPQGRSLRPQRSSSSLPSPRRRWFRSFGRMLAKPLRWFCSTQYPYIPPEMGTSVAQLAYSSHPHRPLWHPELDNATVAVSPPSPQPIEARVLPRCTHPHLGHLGLPIGPDSNVALYPGYHGLPGQAQHDHFHPGISGPVYPNSRVPVCQTCQLHYDHPQSPDTGCDVSTSTNKTTVMRSKTSKPSMQRGTKRQALLRSRGSRCSLRQVAFQEEPSIISEDLCAPVVKHITQPRSILKMPSAELITGLNRARSMVNAAGRVAVKHAADMATMPANKTTNQALASTNSKIPAAAKKPAGPSAPRKLKTVHPASHQAPLIHAQHVQKNAAHPYPPKALADPRHCSMLKYQPSFQDPPMLPYASTVWNWEQRQYLDKSYRAMNPLPGQRY